MPLSLSVKLVDDRNMLLPLLLTAGLVTLLVLMGFVADRLLGPDAQRWVRDVTRDR